MTLESLYEELQEGWGRSRSDLRPIAKVGGKSGPDLQKDSKGRFYVDGKPVSKPEGLKLQWSATWSYVGDRLVKVKK